MKKRNNTEVQTCNNCECISTEINEYDYCERCFSNMAFDFQKRAGKVLKDSPQKFYDTLKNSMFWKIEYEPHIEDIFIDEFPNFDFDEIKK